MKPRNRLRLIALAFMMVIAAITAMQGVANASPPVQVCSNLGNCMNRSGGGTANGTNVINYTQNNANNDFTFLLLSTWCGATGTVHNGENGILCPFPNGSGLYAFRAYNENKYVTIPNFTTTQTKLGNYGDQGYAFVRTPQGFVVSIGVSNDRYNSGGGSNHPYWLNQQATIGPLVVYDRADDEWGCVGSGQGSC
jgi:hypothetical protein